MKNVFVQLTFLLFVSTTLTHCSPRGKVLQSSEYLKAQEVENIYLAVVGSADVKDCFNYLEDYLRDTLVMRGIRVESKYYCCRDGSTNITKLMNEIIPSDLNADHVMSVVITKVVVGYGTSSSREIALSLFNTKASNIVWSGKIKADFEWFVSDENYRAVAKKINQLIITELAKKGIVKS